MDSTEEKAGPTYKDKSTTRAANPAAIFSSGQHSLTSMLLPPLTRIVVPPSSTRSDVRKGKWDQLEGSQKDRSRAAHQAGTAPSSSLKKSNTDRDQDGNRAREWKGTEMLPSPDHFFFFPRLSTLPPLRPPNCSVQKLQDTWYSFCALSQVRNCHLTNTIHVESTLSLL